MKKKKVIISIIVLIIILILSILILNSLQGRNSEENLEYMNSNEIDYGTVSPKMIHTVIGSYEGEVNPKAISKATYFFINNRVPEYFKKCKDDDSTKKYYQKNKDSILIDIGINSEDEFMDLIREIQKLNGQLEFEYSRFVMNEIEVNDNNTSANLYIKYKNNDEILVKVTISNVVYSYKTSIKFSK